MRFLMAARPAFFAASLAPVLVAGAYVRWSEGSVNVGLWVLVAIAMVLLQRGGESSQ